jgi:TolA-binding protein
MRPLLLLVAAISVPAFLTGCLMTRAEVAEQERSREQQNQTAAMQVAHAQDVEEQMRTLNGRIETLENELQKTQKDKAALEKGREADHKEVDTKLKAYEDAMSKLEQQYLAVSQKLEVMQQEKAAAAAAAASEKKSEKKAGGGKSTFDQAEEEFKSKNFQKAVSGYQAYRDNNPKGKNYPEATYKMGVAFQELGMKSDALPFFNEVIEKFPKSKSAEKAKIRLKQLK